MDIKQASPITTMIFFTFFASIASSSNTLKQGEILNSSAHLISTKKLFTLGFFIPDNTSKNSYLGLWYTNYSYEPVWIANRNNPIHNNSGVLTITNTGNLIITHDGGDPIKLYAGSDNVSATATLSDSGNFILNSRGNIERVLWQTFDHPTDTLLPGMKLGVNHRTGKNVSLTSWFNQSLPEDGAFTLEWDPSGARLIIRQRGVIYWSTGALEDGKFEFLESDPLNFNYAYHNDSNENEEYFSYSIMSNEFTLEKRRIFSQWKLDYKGWINDIAGRLVMVRADVCYGYNIRQPVLYEKGCQLWEQPKCRNRHQKFDRRSGFFSGATPYSNSGLSLSDCRNKCWNDCECVGFRIRIQGKCAIWRGKESKFDQDLRGDSTKRYVLISEPTKNSKKKMWIVIASSSSLVLLVSGSLGYLVMRKLRQKKEEKRRREENLFELATSDDFDNANEIKKSGRKGHDIKIFSFGDIVAATNNFSNDNKLGQGGFGLVYKGKLSDERKIAIKRLSKTSGQGVLEFKNELILIAKLQHRNLVRVLGCCIHGDEKMLVYEYMSNKSLDSFLFDTTKKVQLDWRTRLNIIEGIAQGLLYLHKYSRMRVIHRDLKASNVLLDEHMNPKISDFGMARIFKKDETEAMTNRIVGTHGYMSPEYLMGGTFSEKSDVFSFGVLTIEIASGRRNTSFYHLDKLFNLIGFAWMLWKEGEALKLKDPTLLLDDSHVVDNLLRTIQVGLLCVQENATSRPTMSDVIAMLSKETMPLPIPQKPAFFTQQDEPEPTSNEGILTNCSSNYMSISTLEARA